MDSLDINSFLDRNSITLEIQNFLSHFEANKDNLSIKRGIYIYGPPGSGKTFFIKKLLNNMNYDTIIYDAGDIRNKTIIDNITQNNMTDTNVLSLLQKKKRKLAIIMDEIDGMNNGDKGGINSLIKIIRPKKTRKQKLEEISHVPIICIGNYHIDKKINELIKVCHSIIFKPPSDNQISKILTNIMPDITSNKEIIKLIINYIQNDLRKINIIYKVYSNNPALLLNKKTLSLFIPKSYTEDTKDITKQLINHYHPIYEHMNIMNETDRTIVALLWHENIIEPLNKLNKDISIPIYISLLNNICDADYIDRITFQKQIWQFNEMSSLIKIFYNNYIFHKNYTNKINISNIRFTKVLTKYSTEYNNYLFILNLCQILNLDKKDLFSLFIKLENNYKNNTIYEILEPYEISKLDINRMYRYIAHFNSLNIDTYTSDNEND